MDINLLSTMLKEIILENDSVSLPGIGTFTTEKVGAAFSGKGLAINPPYRKLSFSTDTAPDTLLQDLYSSSNGIDAARAGSIIERFLADTRAELMTERTVELPGLGRLRATRNDEVFFIPDDDLDICPDTFGLQSVSLKSHRAGDAGLSGLKLPAPLRKAEAESRERGVSPAVAEASGPGNGNPVSAADGQVPGNAAAVQPSENAAAVQPSGNAAAVQPSENAAAVQSSENAAAVQPSENAAAVQSSGNAAAVQSSGNAAGQSSGNAAADLQSSASDTISSAPATPAASTSSRPSKKSSSRCRSGQVYRVIVWILVVLLVLVACFVILSRVSPELIDKILYTPEELEILNYPL